MGVFSFPWWFWLRVESGVVVRGGMGWRGVRRRWREGWSGGEDQGGRSDFARR